MKNQRFYGFMVGWIFGLIASRNKRKRERRNFEARKKYLRVMTILDDLG
jgi:hypothetical protein